LESIAMSWQRLLTLFLLGALLGCDAPDARFRLNMAYLRRQEKESGTKFSVEQVQDLATTLTAMFGTPDEPYVVGGGSGIDQILDPDKLHMASGPVSSDADGTPRGLYRQHCAHCHGISGDGAGPTAAFLNPYPRDYRMGVFKSKSTSRSKRPTDDDLKRILVNGINGTAMPSFRLLADDELEALIDYVKYLSIRGETERIFLREMGLEFVEDEDRIDKSTEFLIDDVLARVVGGWAQADSQQTPVAEAPQWTAPERLAAAERGRELFYGAVANCIKCHGDSQLGDGVVNDYDDWSKDFHDLSKETDVAAGQAAVAELLTLGGLKPRPIIPRNLRKGTYRLGRRPVDIFRRIHDGIDGTPMPAALMSPPNEQGLSTDDVWCLVEYVMSLPYEALSQPSDNVLTNLRERM
jgi:mono/diheme cytochrome c family protein